MTAFNLVNSEVILLTLKYQELVVTAKTNHNTVEKKMLSFVTSLLLTFIMRNNVGVTVRKKIC